MTDSAFQRIGSLLSLAFWLHFILNSMHLFQLRAAKKFEEYEKKLCGEKIVKLTTLDKKKLSQSPISLDIEFHRPNWNRPHPFFFFSLIVRQTYFTYELIEFARMYLG
jgi:hypothetical protein